MWCCLRLQELRSKVLCKHLLQRLKAPVSSIMASKDNNFLVVGKKHYRKYVLRPILRTQQYIGTCCIQPALPLLLKQNIFLIREAFIFYSFTLIRFCCAQVRIKLPVRSITWGDNRNIGWFVCAGTHVLGAQHHAISRQKNQPNWFLLVLRPTYGSKRLQVRSKE